MTDRDPFRPHRDVDGSIPPRKPGRVDIRDKRDDSAPTSISPSGLLGWAARHGRSWNPIGVALMFLLVFFGVGAGVLYFLNTDLGKGLVTALEVNAAETAALRKELTSESAARAKTDAKVDAILEQLRMNGNSDATTRLGRLEHNDKITGQFLTELNGKRPNDSFPRADKDDFQRAPDLPPFEPPLFVTKQQWSLKPE